MNSALQTLIIVGTVSLFWLVVIVAMLIKFSYKERLAKNKIETLTEMNERKELVIEHYGITELDIGE